MKLIGIEEHFLTVEVRDAWSAIGLELTDPSVGFHSGAIEKRLVNLTEERLALMDETGIDVQVLSLTTPALHDLGPESVDIARRVNDTVAMAVARHPDRFQALATLPVAEPENAARELERCITTLGFQGTMLCGRGGGQHLDHSIFQPIFACAEALHAPILLHPRIPPAAVRDAYYSGFDPVIDACFATFGMGWHYDAGLQFLRLILSGIFDRLPNLQVILGHWGELVLFYAERFARMDQVVRLERPIEKYFRENLYVTASGMFVPHYLARAVEVVGTQRLLFSTDFPYQYRPGRDARSFLEQCGLDAEATAAFAHGNWMRLISKLPAQQTVR